MAKKKIKETVTKTNTAVFLVGVPASGKSTFRAEFLGTAKERFSVISTDDIIEMFAYQGNTTYDAIFKTNIEEAEKVAREYFGVSIDQSKNFIIDRTNLSKKSRASWLSGIPGFYEKVAVVFPIPPDTIWFKRLASRTGKTIPQSVLKSMKSRFEMPTLEEGFDQIMTVQGWTEEEMNT